MTILPHLDDWILDARLAADTVPVGTLELSQFLLMRDATYPWLILVPRITGAVEAIDLDAAAQQQLMTEIAAVSRVLKSITACHKLNVAALGNMVPQLHVHIIARFRDDAAWPSPVWGKAPARPYTAGAMETLVARLRQELGLAA